jgi:hypothetical protein
LINIFSQSSSNIEDNPSDKTSWKENVILLPDSLIMHPYSYPDSCLMINKSDQIIYLDSIYPKTIATYYCSIKIKEDYLFRYFNVSAYEKLDSIRTQLAPNDSLTFIIENIDPCPICKITDLLRDTLVFIFTTNSDSQSALKYLKIGGDIPSSVNDKKITSTKFYLSQNYPNPFNPTTKINYSVSNVGTSLIKFLHLKVYDILGRVVATLVNEYKSSGEYEVEFNGNNIPSGVYFYQLTVGDLISTKKLILMK